MAMTFSLRSMYSQRASCMTSGLFSDGMARKSGVQALGGGEVCRADAALHHALVAVDEFQFGETQQVVGVVGAFGGALGGQLAVFPEEGGQLQLEEQR